VRSRLRCIAYEIDTGRRCRSQVSVRALNQCLCRQHARSILGAMTIRNAAQTRIAALHKWNHISETPREWWVQ
jgi:hypothetical protein